MAKLKKFFKKYYPALIGAIVVGFIIVLPQLEFIFSLGDQYQGIAITETDNDEFYNSRIKDAYDGKFAVANPRVYNPDNNLTLFPSLPENIVALIAKIFQVSVGNMAVLGNFLFPAILYLVFFSLFYQITQTKTLSLLIPAIIILASNIAFFPREIISLFTNPASLTHSAYNRPINPQVTSILFFIFLSLFYSFLRHHKKPLILLTGFSFGLLFYSYLYSWTLAVVFLGLYLLFLLWQRKYKLASQVGIIMAIGLGSSILYWINYFNVSALPIYEAMQKRFGFYESHSPFFSKYLAIDLILLFVLAIITKKRDRNFYFLLAFILACFIAINQQVITGIRFFPGHYHWYYVVPISIFIGVWFIYSLLKSTNKKILPIVFLTLVATVTIINGVLAQDNYFLTEKETYTDFQRYGAVYNWINNSIDPDDVILVSPDKLGYKLTVYTSTYSYLPHRSDRQYIISEEYLRHAYFIKLYLEGKTDPATAIQQDDYALMYTLFGYYNYYKNDCTGCFTDQEMEQLRLDYEEFLKSDFEQNLKKYEINYALWDTKRDLDWDLDQYEFMEFVTEINKVRIYRVI